MPNRAEIRDRALVAALQAAQVHNEEGVMLLDFTNWGSDRMDFVSLNRATLKALMEQAYEAGRHAPVSSVTGRWRQS